MGQLVEQRLRLGDGGRPLARNVVERLCVPLRRHRLGDVCRDLARHLTGGNARKLVRRKPRHRQRLGVAADLGIEHRLQIGTAGDDRRHLHRRCRAGEPQRVGDLRPLLGVGEQFANVVGQRLRHHIRLGVGFLQRGHRAAHERLNSRNARIDRALDHGRQPRRHGIERRAGGSHDARHIDIRKCRLSWRPHALDVARQPIRLGGVAASHEVVHHPHAVRAGDTHRIEASERLGIELADRLHVLQRTARGWVLDGPGLLQDFTSGGEVALAGLVDCLRADVSHLLRARRNLGLRHRVEDQATLTGVGAAQLAHASGRPANGGIENEPAGSSASDLLTDHVPAMRQPGRLVVLLLEVGERQLPDGVGDGVGGRRLEDAVRLAGGAEAEQVHGCVDRTRERRGDVGGELRPRANGARRGVVGQRLRPGDEPADDRNLVAWKLRRLGQLKTVAHLRRALANRLHSLERALAWKGDHLVPIERVWMRLAQRVDLGSPSLERVGRLNVAAPQPRRAHHVHGRSGVPVHRVDEPLPGGGMDLVVHLVQGAVIAHDRGVLIGHLGRVAPVLTKPIPRSRQRIGFERRFRQHDALLGAAPVSRLHVVVVFKAHSSHLPTRDGSRFARSPMMSRTSITIGTPLALSA